MTFFAGDRKPHRRLFKVLCIFATLEPPSVKRVEYNVVITVDRVHVHCYRIFWRNFVPAHQTIKTFKLKKTNHFPH